MNILYIAGVTTPAFRARYDNLTSSAMGGSRKARLIMEALARQGHHVVVLSSAMSSNSRLAWRAEVREKIRDNVTIIYPPAFMLRPFGGALNCFRAAGLIRQLLREFDPDAAIVYNTYLFESMATHELARFKKQIPIVLEVEDLPLARRREWCNLKPRLDQCCWKGMLQRASAFTAVNGYILNLLPDNKPKYLLPGIIDDQLLQNSRARSMPFSGTSRTIGYFGALTEDKGAGVLLDLVPRLPDAWRLVMTGSGPLAPDFERLGCKFPERLSFLGRVDEARLYQAMCACDCTVIPLEQISNEGQGVFPFKTLEFIAAGTHVIASPLATLGDLNLAFIQRWDGKSVDQLLAELACAESKFLQEQSIRQDIITVILDRYSLSGAANLFSKLLGPEFFTPGTQNSPAKGREQ